MPKPFNPPLQSLILKSKVHNSDEKDLLNEAKVMSDSFYSDNDAMKVSDNEFDEINVNSYTPSKPRKIDKF